MKILFIIAPQKFQDHEYSAPRKVLEDAGHQIIIASKDTKKAIGSFGLEVDVDLDIEEVNVDNYDFLVMPGGTGAIQYQQDTTIHKILKQFQEQNKIIAAICISPTTLAYAGILEGKKATVWNQDGQKAKILTAHGATFTDEDVTIDNNIITGNGPEAAQKFGETILEKINQSSQF